MEQSAEDIPTDRLVKAYIKMRDKRGELKAAYEAEDNQIKEQMEVLEQHFLEICKRAGANSINTGPGTIIRSVQTRYWSSDWGEMHQFIKENNALDLLERRISQKAMAEFLKNHPDKMPKGLNANSEYVVTIRRK